MEMRKLFLALKYSKAVFCYLLLRIFCNKTAFRDVDSWSEVLPIKVGGGRMLSFALYFRNLPEFRSEVYWRIGRMSHLLSVFAGKHPCLYFDTPPERFGSGLVIQHGHSTIIHAERIGECCQIWQNVTIGKKVSGGKKPIIGNNVKIYAGSVVLGDITIGDNVQIGANSVVIKDVPANCVVVGNPARIIRRNGVRVNEKL